MNAELCAQVSNYLFEIQITLSNVLVLPVCFSPISSGRDSLEIDDVTYFRAPIKSVPSESKYNDR